MAIPESQLDTWSHQGSVTQSRDTYAAVKGVLEASDAPYASRSHISFLQGSYGNDTNIYADSDVDIVMRLNSVFYHNINELPDDQQKSFHAIFSNADYSYADFKRDVIAQLRKGFGEAVTPGKKAIFVAGSGNRRDTDVVACSQYRKYARFKASGEPYIEGICFWDTKGNQIVNYPKRHSDNCTAKHQNCNQWFKPTVRIFKNMRNGMIADNYIKDGLAPSYFLEGMLYNVPNSKFGSSYQNTIANCLNWLLQADRSKLLCANEQYYLLHPSSLVTWRTEKYDEFLNAAVKYWNAWGS